MAARALAVCPCHSSGSIALSTAQPRIVSASRSPGRCMPSLCRAAIEQFRQLGEIDCHLPCLVNRSRQRSEEHTSELQSPDHLVCRLLLEKKKNEHLARHIGLMMPRTLGGMVSGLLFVLPSLFILIAFTWVYLPFENVPPFSALFYEI